MPQYTLHAHILFAKSIFCEATLITPKRKTWQKGLQDSHGQKILQSDELRSLTDQLGGKTMLVSWLGHTTQGRSALLESKVWVKISKLMNECIHILIHEVVRQLQPSQNSYGMH